MWAHLAATRDNADAFMQHTWREAHAFPKKGDATPLYVNPHPSFLPEGVDLCLAAPGVQVNMSDIYDVPALQPLAPSHRTDRTPPESQTAGGGEHEHDVMRNFFRYRADTLL
jgi:hypothetical protein